jgi:hypothetical protein
MQSLSASTRGEAWLQAAQVLARDPDWEAFHFVVEVGNATRSSPRAQSIERRVNDFLVEHQAQPLETVAETLFPASEYVRYGPSGVYERYPNEVYPAIRDDNSWGTYAYRLAYRCDSDGEPFSPLRDCVEKMRKTLSSHQTFRGAFELDVVDSGFDLRTYDARLDRGRFRNAPCLSHLSFKIGPGNLLFLSATYRFHYYMERFLGNLLGLGQLQRFICDQTGLEPGPVLCVSTLAQLDTAQWTKREVRELLRECAGLPEVVT